MNTAIYPTKWAMASWLHWTTASRRNHPWGSMWVCLKMGYTPNYSHLVGIMIINHWVQWGTLFSDKPMYFHPVFGEWIKIEGPGDRRFHDFLVLPSCKLTVRCGKLNTIEVDHFPEETIASWVFHILVYPVPIHPSVPSAKSRSSCRRDAQSPSNVHPPGAPKRGDFQLQICQGFFKHTWHSDLVGGIHTPLKNISQLGWYFSKIWKNVPNHQPVIIVIIIYHYCYWYS